MEFTTLGHSGLRVSRVCLGGLSFGRAGEGGHRWLLDQKRCTEMIAHALDMGVNFIDTANKYAEGTSEEFIGKALRDLGVPRDRVVLGTKVYFNATTPEHLTRKAVFSEIEASLRRLQTDYVDLYQVHRFDYDTPVEETMEALDALVRSGRVRAIGASSMYGYQFHNMQLAAQQNGLTLFCTMQNHYNLLYREDERELIPVCRQFGVDLIPYSPLASGHLAHPGWDSGTARSRTDRVAAGKYDRMMEEDLPIIGRVEEIAASRGVPMSCIALSWLYSRGVAAPIVGATKTAHFDDAVRAVEIHLSREECRYLEELYRPHPVSGAI